MQDDSSIDSRDVKTTLSRITQSRPVII